MSDAEHPISRFPVPDLADVPADVRERILAVQERSGFVPNVFLALAHRPDEFRAFFAYHDALMEKPGNLTKAEREMIVVATRMSAFRVTKATMFCSSSCSGIWPWAMVMVASGTMLCSRSAIPRML